MQITGREHDMRCQRKGPSLVVSRFGRSYRSICIISDYCKIQLSLNRKSGTTKKHYIYANSKCPGFILPRLRFKGKPFVRL